MIILVIDGLTKHFKRAWSYQVWSSSFVSLQLDSEPLSSVLYPETLNCIQFYFLGIHTSIPLGWKFFLSLWESNSHLSSWSNKETVFPGLSLTLINGSYSPRMLLRPLVLPFSKDLRHCHITNGLYDFLSCY